MSHLDIFSISYEKKKGRESNWQFDSQRITLIGAMVNFCSLLELVSFKGGLHKTPLRSSPIINKNEIESSFLKPQDNVETNINVESESCLKCKDPKGHSSIF
jgi:hypothetical protein